MQAADKKLPITVELQDMMSYSKLGLIGLIALIALVVLIVIISIVVKKIKNAVVSTSRKEGELMDGDKLILGEGENRIELQLSFIEHSDITAADSRDERSDEPRKAKRMPGR